MLHGGYAVVLDVIHGLHDKVRSEHHQPVIDIAHGVAVGDGSRHTMDDATGVDVVVEEESRHARLRLTIDDSPVDGSGTAILR